MSENEITLAQKMVEELTKISTALKNLNTAGIPKQMIIAYLNRSTKIKVTDIRKLLDAMEEMSQELSQRIGTE